MIVFPNTPEQEVSIALFMQEKALVKPMADARHIGWVDASNPDEMKLLGAVCFNTFIGSTCQIHVALNSEGAIISPELPRIIFKLVFDDLKLKKVLGVVNSNNEKAMRMNIALGYVEEYRMPGLHDGGGDIVIFSMTKDQCRFLRQEEPEAA